jgi:DNA mismatch repair protein MutL
MFEWNKKLLMIDQHAFHERVIFERLSKNAKMLLISQPMMIPEVYTLSPEEAQNLEKNQSRLRDIGFNLNIWPEGTVEILAIPALLIHANKESLLAELAEKTWVDHDLNEAADISASVLETIACHSAVRSGEELTENHLADLITQAQQVDFYHNCPHGRRVFRWFERHEIGRWFDRL